MFPITEISLGRSCYIPDASWAHRGEDIPHAQGQLKGDMVGLGWGAIRAPQPCKLGLSGLWDMQPRSQTQSELHLPQISPLWCNTAAAPC